MASEWVVGLKIILVALAVVAVALGLLIHHDINQALVACFFIVLGIYKFIFPFLDNREITLGVGSFPATDSLFLRVPIFILGLFLYFGGMYRLLA